MTTAMIPTMNLVAAIGDPDGTRTITSLVALLVALGLALVMVAIWLFKSTRPDPELLAPLEAMGERSWRRLDPVGQRRRLDELRPAGADPIEPSVAPPAFDDAFDVAPSSPGFDDLQDDGMFGVDPDADAPIAPTHEPLVGADTPQQLDRPTDEFEDHEIDPDLLAAATADLDAEIGANPTRRETPMSGADPVGAPGGDGTDPN